MKKVSRMILCVCSFALISVGVPFLSCSVDGGTGNGNGSTQPSNSTTNTDEPDSGLATPTSITAKADSDYIYIKSVSDTVVCPTITFNVTYDGDYKDFAIGVYGTADKSHSQVFIKEISSKGNTTEKDSTEFSITGDDYKKKLGFNELTRDGEDIKPTFYVKTSYNNDSKDSPAQYVHLTTKTLVE